MIIIDIEPAGARLPELIEEAGAGERIVISRDGEPLATLVPIPRAARTPEVAARVEPVAASDEMFTPLPDDELDAWIRRESDPER